MPENGATDLPERVRRSLPPHWTCAAVNLVPELPKTSNGKIARFLLKTDPMSAPQEIEERINALLAGAPYKLGAEQHEAGLLALLKDVLDRACERSPQYRNFAEHWPINYRKAGRIADLPYLPVGVFKAESAPGAGGTECDYPDAGVERHDRPNAQPRGAGCGDGQKDDQGRDDHHPGFHRPRPPALPRH